MWFALWVLAVINGSDFINNPWNTTFGTYTDLLGAGFYIIPLCFIAGALWLKTHNSMAVSTFIWVSGLLLVSGSIFIDYPEAAFLFFMFTLFGLVGTIMVIIRNKKFYG